MHRPLYAASDSHPRTAHLHTTPPLHIRPGGSKSFDRRAEKDKRREEAGRMAASSHQVKRMVRVHSPEAITAQELPGGW